MANLVIRCSETGREVATGIDTEQATLERLPEVISTLACPACGRVHRWRPAEARLAPVPAP